MILGLEGVGRTFGGVAGLVILCKPFEVHVLDPRHPLLILIVVRVLGPLHFDYFW